MNNFQAIEEKRQNKRQESNIYQVKEDENKPKFYILDMFPYPSGAGLHVGHPKGYIASDVLTRKKILEGFSVLHPMGFDTFGLGTEQYAIENKMKPQVVAQQNIQNFIGQLKNLGLTYDRDRSFSTADPDYYKRTQRIFLQFYNHYYDEESKKAKPIAELQQKLQQQNKSDSEIHEIIDNQRLAYIDHKPINRCPHCKTGLANEDLDDGKCERCGSEVEQKPMRQRVLRITKYAERLIEGLDTLDRDQSTKDLQTNRIGKSEGSQFKMYIISENSQRMPKNNKENTEKGIKKLSKENNDGTYDIIGLAMKVHRELGPGLQEKIYVKGLAKLLRDSGHQVELEQKIAYKIDGDTIGYGFVDILVDGTIALELKSRKFLIGDYYKQLRTYINQSENINCGLLLNFYNGKLEYKRLEKDYDLSTLNMEKTDNSQPFSDNSQTILSHSQIILSNSLSFEIYTTRLDTIFGMTFVVMAPEHPLVDKITTPEYLEKVEKYKEQAKHKTQLERTELQKEKTGQFTGAYAINPFNGQEVPIYIGDYVLANYGTGVVMAVPAHDERDFEFAKKHNIPIVQSIDNPQNPIDTSICYTEKGVLIDSGKFSGLSSDDAIIEMQKRLQKNGIGGKKINYKIQDRVFSRQRYRGEPFPIVFCEKCGTVPLSEKDLPLTLPDVENYEPTGTEEGPLADIDFWINTTCPKCGSPAKRESNTMPGRAGSSRYWLRFMDNKNQNQLVSPEKEKYRGNVDLYVGGAEHVTRHMIYARFWQQFLYDIGVVSQQEPFKKYTKVGLIMAEDGRKMSKRRGNVINPDDIIKEYGSDTLRTYEMFMGPFEQAIARNTNGIKGIKKFLDKIYLLFDKISPNYESDKNTQILLNQSIKKVGEDIDGFRHNTAISQLMILVNHLSEQTEIDKDSFEKLCVLISPFAPHLAEELREKLGHDFSIFTKSTRPKYDEKFLVADTITLAVQFNGKMRGTIEINKDATQDEALNQISNDEKLAKQITGEIKKIIYIPGKIINIIL